MAEAAGNAVIDQYLSGAADAVRQGDAASAAHKAKASLAGAVAAGDRHLQARACLALAQALLLECRMRWAHHFAKVAHQIFWELGDGARLLESLPVVSYAQGALGHDAQAARAARDIISLSVDLRSDHGMAVGMNYQGIAAFWGGDFGTARSVLEASRSFVGRSPTSAAAAIQPLANGCFAEVLRLGQGERSGAETDARRLAQLVSTGWVMADKGQTAALTAVASDIGLLLLEFASCFLATRMKQRYEADAFQCACMKRAGKLPASSWLQVLPVWAAMDQASAAGNLPAALAHAERMKRMAEAGEHEHLKTLAALLSEDVKNRLCGRPSGPTEWRS